MDFESFQQAKWLSVYGAFVAAQVQWQMQSGHGAPSQKDVERYVEEAREVANMASEAAGDPRR